MIMQYLNCYGGNTENKANSTGRNSYLHCKCGQESMTGEDIDSRGEPSTTVFLNDLQTTEIKTGTKASQASKNE